MKSTYLGHGVLGWDARDRRSDRYGAVGLGSHPYGCGDDDEKFLVLAPAAHLVGRKGTLVCLVEEVRESGHIGDIFHGVYPSMPDVGERVELGTGELFVEVDEYGFRVGLRPDDGRDAWWLYVPNLYRVHDQTVSLSFEEPE